MTCDRTEAWLLSRPEALLSDDAGEAVRFLGIYDGNTALGVTAEQFGKLVRQELLTDNFTKVKVEYGQYIAALTYTSVFLGDEVTCGQLTARAAGARVVLSVLAKRNHS